MRSPFQDLNKLQINKLFDLLNVHSYSFKKNEDILPTIKSENIVCIVLEGEAQISYIEYNGNEIILENLTKFSVFGTNISGINNDDCEIVSKTDSEILVINYNDLLNPKNLNHVYFNIFLYNLFDITNNKFRESNKRIRILEKKQIRDKLLEYFDIEYSENPSKALYLPFSLKDLADYIAVNRSAMFRELKHLKDDRLIEIKNRKITLLYK